MLFIAAIFDHKFQYCHDNEREREREREDFWFGKKQLSKDAKGVLECLVSGHLVEGLFEFDADFLVLFLPFVEFLDQGVQLLLQLSSFTLSSGCLDLSKLQVQRQISDLLLALLVSFEGVGF